MKAAEGLLVISLIGLALSKKEGVNPLVSVLQLIPKDEAKLLAVIRLFEEGELDFWRAPSKVNEAVDIMVDAAQKSSVEAFAMKHGIFLKVMVNDLSKLIAEKEGGWSSKALSRLARGGRRDIGDSTDDRKETFGLSMKDYHSYPDIVAWMHRIAARLVGRARVFSIGRTVEGREMMGIHFTSNPSTSSAKRVVWIDGGIHAREWTAVHSTVYFIFLLANGLLQNDSKLTSIFEQIDVVVFPVLNPDGYEYTRSDPQNALVRMWRKNRSQERCGMNRRGVDLNRNFAYRFAEVGTSFHPCSEIYHGAGAFSEPETRNVRDALMNSSLTGRIDAYVSLHAYSQLFIYPYSNRKNYYPEDVAELKKVAQRAVTAISKLFGTRYQYGNGPDIIYAYAGGSSDFAKETAKIKYSFTIELSFMNAPLSLAKINPENDIHMFRPSYYSISAWNGFVLNKSQLIPTARETFDGIMVVLQTVAAEARIKNGDKLPPSPQPSSSQFRPVRPANTLSSMRSPQAGACRDAVDDCKRWLSQNPLLCSTSRIAMKRQCSFTCNLC